MVKKIGRAVLGSLKWVFYVVVLAAVLMTMLIMAVIATPVVFVVLWRAQSVAETLDGILESISDKTFVEMEKLWARDLEKEFDDENMF
jgi:hypothetical protein